MFPSLLSLFVCLALESVDLSLNKALSPTGCLTVDKLISLNLDFFTYRMGIRKGNCAD